MLADSHARVITCGICFKVLTRPVTLTCGDNFCFECVRAALDRNGDTGLHCPSCATVMPEISRRSISTYLNTALEEHIKGLSTGIYTGPQCEWCGESKSSLQCHECMATFCADCAAAVHKSAFKRTHTVGPLTDAYRRFCHRCPYRGHEEYKAEFFCVQCNDLCCAYCLQVGPHKEHTHISAAQAAAELRQRLPQDVAWLAQRARSLEEQGTELNATMRLYSDSYDSVENMITERFNSFKQQLMQHELEVRKRLTALRDSGDEVLTSTRKEFLKALNSANDNLLRLRCLQDGGPDSEILRNRSLLHSSALVELPRVSGSGFKLDALGDFSFTNLGVHLDLQNVKGTPVAAAPGLQSTYPLNLSGPRNSRHGGGAALLPRDESLRGSRGNDNAPSFSNMRHYIGCLSASDSLLHSTAVYGAEQHLTTPSGVRRSSTGLNEQLPTGSLQSIPPETPLRLTFPVDADVEATMVAEGVQLRCVARGGNSVQIGVRSKEVFRTLLDRYPSDDGVVSWQIRLDIISDSFIGIVEKTKGLDPAGFYWKPTGANMTDGDIGHVNAANVQRLPVCRNGDLVRFIYDVRDGTLRVVVNGTLDVGAVVRNVHPHVAACFIFYPGEAMTLLF